MNADRLLPRHRPANFHERLIHAMMVAVEEQRSPARRADLLRLVVQSAKVAEIRQELADSHAVVLPASVKRADAVAELHRVLAI